MDIPDLVGKSLKNALDIIEKQYPILNYEIIYYNSPRSNQKAGGLSETERVVRQRLVNDKKLELVVSFFKEKPN
jgi:hypothetical protein